MSDMENVMNDLQEVERINKQKKTVLADLLDENIRQQDKHLALQTKMGKTAGGDGQTVQVESWVTTHTMDWVSNKLKMGSEMPLMKSSIDETGRLRVNEGNAEELKQRAPDWTRQIDLAAYLINDRQRKFSTILAVVSPPWVDDPNHDNWGSDGRAVENAIKVEKLDTQGTVGLIDLSNTHIYALDGQHRVMGIKGVVDLQSKGFIEMKKRDGSSTNKKYESNWFLERYRSDITDLQSLLNESVSVEYIPAVIAGETRLEANQRVRDVFVSINSYAKKTLAGENILLDERDGFSIVARKIATSHALFRDDNTNRVNWEGTTIKKNDLYFTTLDMLRRISERYLLTLNPSVYKTWGPEFKEVPLRPSDEEIEVAFEELSELFNYIANLPVFQRILRGNNILDLREFPDEKNEDREGNILLRPIGQEVLARTVSYLRAEHNMTTDELFDKLKRLDNQRGFSAMDHSNIWYGILYNPRKNNIIPREHHRTTAVDLLVYLLKGADEQARRKLLGDVVELRSDEHGRWVDFEGNHRDSPSIEGIYLPQPVN